MKSWNMWSRLEAFQQSLPDPQSIRGYINACCIGILLGLAIELLLNAYPGFPLGGPADFTVYYTAAHIVRAGDGHRLYDLGLQASVAQSILRPYGLFYDGSILPYNYPPFFSILFVPFTFLGLQYAFVVWNAINLALLLCIVRLLWCPSPGIVQKGNSVSVVLAVSSFYPVFRVFWNGQSSLVVATTLALAFVCLKRRHEVLGGSVLALGLVKPQLVAVVFLAILARARWRFVLGFLSVAGVLAMVSEMIVGVKGLESYATLAMLMPSWDGVYGMVPSSMPNIRGTLVRLSKALDYIGRISIPPETIGILTLIISVPVLILVILLWKTPWDTSLNRFSLQYSLTIVGSLLLSFHLYDHDLTLLIVPAFIVWRYFASLGRIKEAFLLTSFGHLGHFLPWFVFATAGWAQSVVIVIVVIAVILWRELLTLKPQPCDAYIDTLLRPAQACDSNSQRSAPM